MLNKISKMGKLFYSQIVNGRGWYCLDVLCIAVLIYFVLLVHFAEGKPVSLGARFPKIRRPLILLLAVQHGERHAY